MSRAAPGRARRDCRPTGARCPNNSATGRGGGDEEVRAEEEAEIQRLEIVRIVGGVVEPDTADDDEHVAFVLLDLDAGVRAERVLDGQRVEVEYLLEHRVLVPARRVNVHPEYALLAPDDLAQLAGQEILAHRAGGITVERAREVRFGVRDCAGRGSFPFASRGRLVERRLRSIVRGRHRARRASLRRHVAVGCGHWTPLVSWIP